MRNNKLIMYLRIYIAFLSFILTAAVGAARTSVPLVNGWSFAKVEVKKLISGKMLPFHTHGMMPTERHLIITVARLRTVVVLMRHLYNCTHSALLCDLRP